MLLMPPQITLYQEMSTLSDDMVSAARSGDWDRLIELERAVVALRDTLMQDGSSLSEEDMESKVRLIQRILENDAEVRRHTEPRLEQLRRFLGGRPVERACGAGL